MATTTTIHDKISVHTSAVWSYGVGTCSDASIDDFMDSSARFIPVPQHQQHRTSRSSGMTMEDDDEESTRVIMEQENHDEILSLSPLARPTSSQGSLEFIRPTIRRHRQSTEDVNQIIPPSLSCEERPRPSSEETSDHHEDTEVPLVSSPPDTPKQKKRSSYSDSWDDLQLTPSDLLSKILPNKVKEAQAIISAKKQQESIPRAQLYKMSRSECRSLLRKSLTKFDSLDAGSNHTAVTVVSSWSHSLNHQEPSLEDKKKWGVDGLSKELQEEGTKKKKKRKSTTKKGEKSTTKGEKEKSKSSDHKSKTKSSSCDSLEKLESKKEKKSKSSDHKSKTNKEKKQGSSLKKSSSCDRLQKLESKKEKKSKSSDHSTGKKTKPKRKSAPARVQHTGN